MWSGAVEDDWGAVGWGLEAVGAVATTGGLDLQGGRSLSRRHEASMGCLEEGKHGDRGLKDSSGAGQAEASPSL